MIAIPTAYPQISETELQANGFQMAIYANQLLRAAVPAMQRAAVEILRHGRALELDADLLPVPELLALIPEPGVMPSRLEPMED